MTQETDNRGDGFERFHKARVRIGALCRDDKTMECLSSQVTEGQLDKLEAALNRLEDNDIYVAAMGMQGVGKSTLINALLFGRRILPSDVTETTVVLTKVYGANGGGERGQVHFLDGRIEDVALEPEILRKYVDNELNPENEKNVKELRCFLDSPLLSQGICLVDTPGVGSLIEKNGKVTLDFLPNIAASLFVTMTTPCMIKTEVAFLSSAWEYCGRFFLVQNVWSEDQNNVEDCGKDILSKLNAVAEEWDTKPDIGIYPVDVHRAMEGMANLDQKSIDESGLPILIKALSDFLASGAVHMKLKLFEREFKLFMERGLRAMDLRKTHLDRESKDVLKDLAEKERQFNQDLEDTEDRWRQEERKFGDIVRDATRKAEDRLIDALDDLQDRVFGDIDSEKMSGEHVAESFERRVQVTLKEPLAAWQREVREAVEDLQRSFAKELGAIIRDFELNFGRLKVDPDWEYGFYAGDFFEWAGKLGISLLVMETILSWLGIVSAASAAAGPAGWILAGVTLAAGWLLNVFWKDKVKNMLKKEVRDAIRSIKKTLREKLAQAQTDVTSVGEVFRQRLKEEIAQLRFQIQQARSDAMRSDEERRRISSQLTHCENHIRGLAANVLKEMEACLINP